MFKMDSEGPRHVHKCDDCKSVNKIWRVVAHEVLVHTWDVDAETEDQAREKALEGCPLPDGYCESRDFEIVSVNEEGGAS